MMTQEEYMDLLALRRQGKTIVEIAEELDYHPATIAKWLKAGGPPPARSIDPAAAVVDARWAARIEELIRPPAEKLLASSVFEIIWAEGSRAATRASSATCGPGVAPASGPA